MRSKLLRTTAVALLGFGLAGAPLSLAQSMDPATNQTAPAATPGSPQTPPEGGITGGAPANDALPTAPSPDATALPAAPGADPAASPASTASNMQPAGTVRAKDMTGASVQSSQGEDLATLSDLVVDPDGRVTGAILTVGGVLGVGGKEVIVPWEELTVGSDGATITIAMSQQQLDKAPAFQPLPKEAESTSVAPTPGTGNGPSVAPTPTGTEQ